MDVERQRENRNRNADAVKKRAVSTTALSSISMMQRLFGCVNGNFSEFFHHFAKVKSGFAGTCAGGFVSLNYLSISILFEYFEFFFDFFYKFFHTKIV